jgi:hypothetical protein
MHTKNNPMVSGEPQLAGDTSASIQLRKRLVYSTLIVQSAQPLAHD